MTDTRPCTCAPDERPYPCQHQYALGLCRKAEIRSLRAQLDRCIAQIGDLAKLRSEEEITHGHVMGRIAITLFGEQNNRIDEECVEKVAEVVRERDRLRQHLHDEHQRHIGTMDERDALAAENLTLRNAAVNAAERFAALAALLRDSRWYLEEHIDAMIAIAPESHALRISKTREKIAASDAALKDKP